LFSRLALTVALLATLAGCNRTGEIDPTGGIRVARSICPAVGIPALTGDVTLFDPPQSREARAIDVVATITNLRTRCDDSGPEVVTTVTFDVLARREAAGPARQVVLPYFVTVVRGGNVVTAKRISRVAVDFEAGATRASATAEGTGIVEAAAATLPDDVRKQITRRRRPGQEDAAIDPLADPAVRQAVARASFEVLVGFQLDPEQLRYNATR
jgi:hypothetical protein